MLTRNKMLFLSIILAIIFGSVIWQFFIENYRINDVEIPASQNITYNDHIPINIDSKTLEKEFENKQKYFPKKIIVIEKNQIKKYIDYVKQIYKTKKIETLYDK